LKLDIIYEDNICIVINKPAGLAAQGGKGVGVSLDRVLAETWPERPLLVHRLDRDTSGLILVAKTKEAARYFSRLLGTERAVVKRYLAVCKGKPEQAEGVIRAEIDVHGAVKSSETRYRLLSASSGEEAFSLLELELGTGRMHQIRRHLAITGNPVLGDDKYGDFKLNHQLRKTLKLRNLLLHASRLIIPPTADVPPLDLSAPLPAYFQDILTNAGIGGIIPIREGADGKQDF
jgi:23S rRNA pseudouridine955/2504/2580 synthase